MFRTHSSDPRVGFHLEHVVAVVVGKDLDTASKKAWIPNGIAP